MIKYSLVDITEETMEFGRTAWVSVFCRDG